MAENPNEIDKTKFAGYGIRIGAYLTDIVIITLIVIPINYLNLTNYKNFLIYLATALIGVLYKPMTEHYFGATIGKYVLDLKVTDHNFNRINLKQSFLRSSILMIAPILYIPIYYFAFNNPEIMNIESFMDISKSIIGYYPIESIISKISFALLVVDLVFMTTDKEKLFRSLHDRIGKTYVLKTK